MFCKRTTVSVLFILLIAEVFHHCSAQDDPQLPSISVDQPPSNLGLGSNILPMPFANLNPAMMMAQLSNANITENIPKYTDSFLQTMKTLIKTVNEIRELMPGLDENGQNVEQ